MKMTRKRNKGITLVALVVTVIILLILAGISIASLTGNGIFEKAKLAEEKQENAEIKEEATLRDYENKIGEYVDGTRLEGSGVKTVVAWQENDYKGNISLGNYNISDYDFIYLCARYTNTAKNLQTSIYSVKDIEIGSSMIGVTNNSRYCWYVVTNNNTLTFNTNDLLVLKSVILIKL